MMAWLHMSSSKDLQTLLCLSSPSLSRGQYCLLCIEPLLMSFRWIFYSAVNSVTPQLVLNLGFEDNSWAISIRQLAYTVVTLVASVPIT